MKLAASALLALALMAGNTGCCLFDCGAYSGCGGYLDECGGCEDPSMCGQCGGGCYGMGCGPLHRIFNWSRCCDCCDACGNWTGAPIVSRGPGMMDPGYVEQPAPYDEPGPADVSDGRVVPGSVRVTTRSADSAPARIAEEPAPLASRQKVPSAKRRPKRITSSPVRPR